jgi:hypothetical protein
MIRVGEMRSRFIAPNDASPRGARVGGGLRAVSARSVPIRGATNELRNTSSTFPNALSSRRKTFALRLPRAFYYDENGE